MSDQQVDLCRLDGQTLARPIFFFLHVRDAFPWAAPLIPPHPPHPRAQFSSLSSAPSPGGSGLSGTKEEAIQQRLAPT